MARRPGLDPKRPPAWYGKVALRELKAQPDMLAEPEPGELARVAELVSMASCPARTPRRCTRGTSGPGGRSKRSSLSTGSAR